MMAHKQKKKKNMILHISNNNIFLDYKTDVMFLLLRYAFNERNIHRIRADILEDNKASLKLHKKIGFVEEGIMRDAIYKNGIYKKLIILSILKSDLKSSNIE